MRLRELREWINFIPVEFDEYSVIFRDYKSVEGTDLELMIDNPIVAGFIDQDHEEICLLDNDSYQELQRLENESDIQD